MSAAQLRVLLDKQAIEEVVLELARATDRCDARLMSACFHDDATDDHGYFVGRAAEFVPWVMEVLAGLEHTTHTICNVLVGVSGDEAVAESGFLAPSRRAGPDGSRDSFGAGRYLDRFERRGAEWRIAHREVVYDWNWSAPSGTDLYAVTEGLTLGRRDRDDRSYSFPEPREA